MPCDLLHRDQLLPRRLRRSFFFFLILILILILFAGAGFRIQRDRLPCFPDDKRELEATYHERLFSFWVEEEKDVRRSLRQSSPPRIPSAASIRGIPSAWQTNVGRGMVVRSSGATVSGWVVQRGATWWLRYVYRGGESNEWSEVDYIVPAALDLHRSDFRGRVT